MDNIATVQDIYAAFGRGDIEAILARLAEDVSWDEFPDSSGAAQAGVLWLAPRRGRTEVGGFFEALGALEIGRFQPLAFMAGDDRVAVLIDIELTERESGRRMSDREVHVWRFDDAGDVVEFRHHVDTAKHVALAGLVSVAASAG